MISTPTENYISDEISSSYEIDSLTLNVDDVVVTSSVDLSQEEKNRFPWLSVTHLDECDMAERQFKRYISDVILAPYDHIKHYPEFFNLADLYYDEHGLGQNSECFALIEEGKKNLDYFWTILNLITNVTQGNLVVLKNLTSRLKVFQYPKSVDDFDAKLRQVCGWRESFAYQLGMVSRRAVDYLEITQSLQKTTRKAITIGLVACLSLIFSPVKT